MGQKRPTIFPRHGAKHRTYTRTSSTLPLACGSKHKTKVLQQVVYVHTHVEARPVLNGRSRPRGDGYDMSYPRYPTLTPSFVRCRGPSRCRRRRSGRLCAVASLAIYLADRAARRGAMRQQGAKRFRRTMRASMGTQATSCSTYAVQRNLLVLKKRARAVSQGSIFPLCCGAVCSSCAAHVW